jgi:hypothetical protein
LRFRATELAVVLLCLSAGPAVGCQRTTGGTATGAPRSDPAEPVPGVETTLPEHIPPNALVCLPPPAGGRTTVASVPDPAAPRLTIALPEGWNPAAGTGDVALTSTGPGGISEKVSITPTDLDPGGAFLRYAADLRTRNPGVTVSVTPAQFCGYSSQLLSGAGAAAFADRVTHIWTNTKSYLAVVHLEGPAGAPGFDAAKSTAMQQFGVVIP